MLGVSVPYRLASRLLSHQPSGQRLSCVCSGSQYPVGQLMPVYACSVSTLYASGLPVYAVSIAYLLAACVCILGVSVSHMLSACLCYLESKYPICQRLACVFQESQYPVCQWLACLSWSFSSLYDSGLYVYALSLSNLYASSLPVCPLSLSNLYANGILCMLSCYPIVSVLHVYVRNLSFLQAISLPVYARSLSSLVVWLDAVSQESQQRSGLPAGLMTTCSIRSLQIQTCAPRLTSFNVVLGNSFGKQSRSVLYWPHRLPVPIGLQKYIVLALCNIK